MVSKTRCMPGPEPMIAPCAELALDALEQQTVLALEARALERAADDERMLVVVEGLGDVVLGAGLHRLHGDLLRAVRR